MSFNSLWSWVTGNQSRSMDRNAKRARGNKFSPVLQTLEDRTVMNGYLAIGAGAGAAPLVAIRVDKVDALNGSPPNNSGQPAAPSSDGRTDFTSQIFQAYDIGFQGGVQVASGNFDGDYTTPDSLITATGPGGGPHIVVYQMLEDPATGNIVKGAVIDSFMAYDARFRGGVNIATGDLDGDGRAELITAPMAGGGPHVKIWKQNANGKFQVVAQFMAFDPAFRGGVSIASGQGYQTPIEVRQVLDAQLPDDFGDNFAIVPYNPATTRPGLNLTNPDLDFPLVGGIGVFDPQDPNNPFPGPSNTLDANNDGLPYVTIASGVITYQGANLLNNFGNLAYTPNRIDPLDPITIPPQTPLVFATWPQDPDNPPDFAFTDGVVYGPFVQLRESGNNAPAVVTRFIAPPGQVNARNQLVVGAGAGGGPHVKIYDWQTNGNGGLSVLDEIGFMAFDPSFRGGVNVGIGDVVELPDPSIDPATLQPRVDPGNGTTVPTITFPYDNSVYRQYNAEVIVSMASGGSQVVVYSDFNPNNDARTRITELQLVPTFLQSKVVFDPTSPLTGFTSLQNVASFDRAIDPQFTGKVFSTSSSLAFNGSATTAGAQYVFAAGANPNNPPARGTRVKIFDQLGPNFINPVSQDPLDDFFAFTTGVFPNGVSGISYGFGALPVPTRDIVELTPISVDTIDDPRLI